MRRLALLLLLGSSLWASQAAAAVPEVRSHGPRCTPAGCSGAEGSSPARAAGFAAASLASIVAARRRGRPAH